MSDTTIPPGMSVNTITPPVSTACRACQIYERYECTSGNHVWDVLNWNEEIGHCNNKPFTTAEATQNDQH